MIPQGWWSGIKGLAYTPFALSAVFVMLSLIIIPSGMDNRDVGYASDSVLESYETSWEKNQFIFTNKALQNLSDTVVATNSPIGNVENATESVVSNGSFDSKEISNYSFRSWEVRSQSLAESSGVFAISSKLENISVEVENLSAVIKTHISVDYQRSGRTSTVNRSFLTREGLSQVKDPYLASRGYEAYFNRCGISSPISDSFTEGVADYNGTAYGKASIQPSTSDVSRPIDRVLVTSNPSNYTDAEMGGFAGVVTSQTSISNSSNDVYASNVGIGSIQAGDDLIVHEGEVYRSQFRRIISDSCYISVAGYPGVEERFANETRNYNGSVATFVNETELSADNASSSVGYEYFNDGAVGGLEEVAGVTFGRGNTLDWFRISQDIAQALDVEEITG